MSPNAGDTFAGIPVPVTLFQALGEGSSLIDGLRSGKVEGVYLVGGHEGSRGGESGSQCCWEDGRECAVRWNWLADRAPCS